MSSACFSGEKTMAQLNDEWVDQMLDLYHNGVDVGKGNKETFYFYWLGCKGDWKYLKADTWLPTLSWGKLDDCIYNAYAVYMEYCHTNRKKSACRPWTSKLAFDMSKEFEDIDLKILHFTANKINRFFRLLHDCGFWLSEGERAEVTLCGELFLEGFCTLAARAAKEKLLLFKLRPKLHMFAELILQLKRGDREAPNILTTSCWQDEDFIGVVSQTSRTVHRAATGLSCSLRTLQKCLGRYKLQFARCG
ncbi:unnamed protein product [Durusdinium trenchii]|uniref:Uncharacterized protein n=1 Tax=Durusdinium trenchii TaxID=1381693 RepID=A0ABP0P5U9_9DINO